MGHSLMMSSVAVAEACCLVLRPGPAVPGVGGRSHGAGVVAERRCADTEQSAERGLLLEDVVIGEAAFGHRLNHAFDVWAGAGPAFHCLDQRLRIKFELVSEMGRLCDRGDVDRPQKVVDQLEGCARAHLPKMQNRGRNDFKQRSRIL